MSNLKRNNSSLIVMKMRMIAPLKPNSLRRRLPISSRLAKPLKRPARNNLLRMMMMILMMYRPRRRILSPAKPRKLVANNRRAARKLRGRIAMMRMIQKSSRKRAPQNLVRRSRR
jgi:hypothetical protein